MIWWTGKLSNITVHVQRGATDFAKAIVDGSGAKQMNGSAFDVDGRLSWSGGSVTVTNPLEISSITVNQPGNFWVDPHGGAWGVAGTDPTTAFGVINNGETSVFSDGTFNAEFTNAGKLYVGPTTSATLTLGGGARQTAGYTVLGNSTGTSTGTIKVTGPGTVLHIDGGSISGKGTVDGNLTLGSATLYAGPSGAAGDLTVTKSFTCESDDSWVAAAVWDDEKSSKLVVQADATLLGSLSIDWKNTNPPKRAEHVLVDIQGERCGGFSNYAEGEGTGNQGVRFRKTYKGGDGNDVSLLPIGDLNGKVWGDNDHSKTWNTTDRYTETGLAGVKVTLTGTRLPEPLVRYTGPGGVYGFGDLVLGDYAVTFDAPSAPVGYTITTISGSVGQAEATIPVTLNDDVTEVADVGMGMPKMRVTIAASGSSPLVGLIDGEFDLVFLFDTGYAQYWDYAFALPPAAPYTAYIELRVMNGMDYGGYVVQGGQAAVLLSNPWSDGNWWFYWGSNFTALAGGSVIKSESDVDPNCTVPMTLTFTPIFPS